MALVLLLDVTHHAAAHDLDLGSRPRGSALHAPVTAARECVAPSLHATEPPRDPRVVVIFDHVDESGAFPVTRSSFAGSGLPKGAWTWLLSIYGDEPGILVQHSRINVQLRVTRTSIRDASHAEIAP